LAVHHVWNRGIERCVVFRGDVDRLDFPVRIDTFVRAEGVAVYVWALDERTYGSGDFVSAVLAQLNENGLPAPRGPDAAAFVAQGSGQLANRTGLQRGSSVYLQPSAPIRKKETMDGHGQHG
jgi:hypothetical protein